MRSSNKMRIRIEGCVFCLCFLLTLGLPLGAAQPGYTRVELTEVGTGRKIFSAVLKDGEQVILTWKNSIYGHDVTEVFEAQSGILVLTQMTVAGPPGSPLPRVSPEDVDDFYQTGEAFCARGLAKPFQQVIYRISEIGKPRMKIGERVVDFKKEVGFGGGIVLKARSSGPE